MVCEEEDGRKEQDQILVRVEFGINSDESSTDRRDVDVWTTVLLESIKQGTHATNYKSSNTMGVPWSEHQDYL